MGGEQAAIDGELIQVMMEEKELKSLLNTVVSKIRKEYKPERIILYGSYAYGEPTEDSDIDLFIVKDTQRNRIERYVEVKTIIYDRHRGISVQPLVLTPQEVVERLELGDDFITEIVTKGKTIYISDEKQRKTSRLMV